MAPGQTKERRKVLVFDSKKKFIAIYGSQLLLAKSFGVATPSVKSVCNGTAISVKQHYLRWWEPEIEINPDDDLGVLTLDEYDKLCGVKRKTYKNTRMSRRGWRYGTKKTRAKRKAKDESTDNQPIEA